MMYRALECIEWRYLREGKRSKATIWHKAYSMAEVLQHVEICLPYDTMEIRPRWNDGMEPKDGKNRVQSK